MAANDSNRPKSKPKSVVPNQSADVLKPSVASVLAAIKTWQKTVDKLIKSGKKRSAKEKAIARASQEVIKKLQDPALQAAINDLMQTAQGDLDAAIAQLNQDLLQHRETLIARELESIQVLHISQKQFQHLVETYLHTRHRQPLREAAALEDLATATAYFEQLQPALFQTLRQLNTLPRKPKKARKRELGRSSAFASVGLALLAGNTLFTFHQHQSASYILGGNALLKAMQDVIGDRVE
jgi:ribosomal protein L17